MNYREFGKTGLKVSEIGFGAWAIGGNAHGHGYGATDDKTSIAAIHKAIDLGANFFDTADVYGRGHSEELLGKAIKGKRDRLIIASKVGSDFYQGEGFQSFSENYIRFALEKTLERLNTDYVDVYQLHNPPLKLTNQTEAYKCMKSLKKEGKVRAWGVSIFAPIEGLAILKLAQPDSLQIAYNIFTTRAKDELIPKATTIGCAIIAREPLANGFLTGKYNVDSEFEASDVRSSWPREYVRARVLATQKLMPIAKVQKITLAQLALKYVLTNENIAVIIPGIKTTEQAQDNLAASDLPQLASEALSSISQLQQNNFL
jgi:aryl-alcohol dehydrogenase-like predicted oxidoreductase